jgi:hypothetical protein
MSDRTDSDHTVSTLAQRAEFGEYLHNGQPEANSPPEDADDVPSLDDVCQALSWIVDWCWLKSDGTSRTVHAACVRWVSIAHALFRVKIGKNSEQLANGIGVAENAIRMRAMELRRDLRIRADTRRNRRKG